MSLTKTVINTVSMIVLALGLVVAISQFSGVQAQDATDACTGVALTGGSCDGGTAITTIISTIVDVLSIIVGAVAVIMIIVGGFKYIISSGDSTAITSARSTIIYAIVGLIIVIFAQVIVAYTIGKTGATTTTETETEKGYLTSPPLAVVKLP